MHVGSIDPLSTPVVLNPHARRAMTEATRAAGVFEACGLLFGEDGRIDEASIARNIAADRRRRFEIDPAHLFDAHRRSRAGKISIVGCWHSHPGGSPWPSAEDRAGVHDMGWLWLIVANNEVRAFRPTDGGFAEVALIPPAL